MTRKEVARRRAQIIRHTRGELEAERDRLRKATKDCRDSGCYCHEREWRDLAGVLFLLGEDVPEVPQRWTEDQP